jgi:hypothetical protein
MMKNLDIVLSLYFPNVIIFKRLAPLERRMGYKPLLPPGLHDMSEEDLENHFLGSFPNSSTREKLVNGLKTYLSALENIGISFEVWIDGSFTTEKENPNDIDIVVFGSHSEIDKLPNETQKQLAALLDRINIKHATGCDVLFAVTEDQNRRSYWRGWYGFDRDENPKGIARIEVSP